MHAVILAGGLGLRLSEESVQRPKPMVEIGGKPLLWHIMKIYSYYGITNFLVCLGYKGYVIKEYFANYFLHNSDVVFDLANNAVTILNQYSEPWKVTLIDTGLNTMTGGRLKRILPYIEEDEFCLTYGDGLCNIDIGKLIAFHRSHSKIATITAVQPPGRFGSMELLEDRVMNFEEKPLGDATHHWINGGFFVLNKDVGSYIDNDQSVFEKKPLENICRKGQLKAYRHNAFWQCVDTLRDKNVLDEMWASGNAPWKVWE